MSSAPPSSDPRAPDGWTIRPAARRRQRARGLLGRPRLDPLEGLWLPVRSVHTFGMRFAIDLVWLGRDGAVLRVDRAVPRGRVRTCTAARGGVVEVAADRGPALARALAGRRVPAAVGS
ncbi:unannotated protein [freshwater metagenome]|uniref:Unannotated protein n=1 Tax=freshwater metagenome TaxID=449393 RepID=A0A6J7GK21_9ZZZZ|nr:DUF192 domain-containing protein [Actinomycetota bacterium]